MGCSSAKAYKARDEQKAEPTCPHNDTEQREQEASPETAPAACINSRPSDSTNGQPVAANQKIDQKSDQKSDQQTEEKTVAWASNSIDKSAESENGSHFVKSDDGDTSTPCGGRHSIRGACLLGGCDCIGFCHTAANEDLCKLCDHARSLHTKILTDEEQEEILNDPELLQRVSVSSKSSRSPASASADGASNRE